MHALVLHVLHIVRVTSNVRCDLILLKEGFNVILELVVAPSLSKADGVVTNDDLPLSLGGLELRSEPCDLLRIVLEQE